MFLEIKSMYRIEFLPSCGRRKEKDQDEFQSILPIQYIDPHKKIIREESKRKRDISSSTTYLYDIPITISSKYFENRIKYCFLDCGIKNMGLIILSVTSRWTIPIIEFIQRVNITSLDKSLTEYNSNELADRMDRFFETFRDRLDECERIFIERQPIMGLVAVEQMIFKKYREKAILLSPNSVHRYFRIGKTHGYTYQSRKMESDHIAENYIKIYGSQEVCSYYDSLDRRHDVSDCICMAIYVIEQKRRELEQYVVSLQDTENDRMKKKSNTDRRADSKYSILVSSKYFSDKE